MTAAVSTWRQSHTVCYIMSHVNMYSDIIVFPHVKVWVYMCKCQSPLINTNLHVKFHILFAIVGSFYFTVLMQTLSTPCKYFLELFSLCFVLLLFCYYTYSFQADCLFSWCCSKCKKKSYLSKMHVWCCQVSLITRLSLMSGWRPYLPVW